MTNDKKFRVTCVEDFGNIRAHSGEPIENLLTYYYVSTVEEAKGLTKSFVKSGACQSGTGEGSSLTFDVKTSEGAAKSFTITNPNLAAIEYWDDEGQDWLFWVEE